MKIGVISDTHGKHQELTRPGSLLKLPESDIIIHAGDFTSMGRVQEVQAFMDWFSSLTQYSYRICIAGNHDFMAETSPLFFREIVPANVTYLQDSGIEIKGIQFWGLPWTPTFQRWAFMGEQGYLRERYKQIPLNTDVLITHGPAFETGDLCTTGKRAGCWELKDRLRDVQPQYHVFGHIHEAYGIYPDITTSVNAAILDARYKPVNQPVVFEI